MIFFLIFNLTQYEAQRALTQNEHTRQLIGAQKTTKPRNEYGNSVVVVAAAADRFYIALFSVL